MILWLIACQFSMDAAPEPTPRSPDAPPTVALITIDTWRADHFSDDLTPNIWALASLGERYEHAFSPMGLTTPAHASMLTGLAPWENGAWANNHHGYGMDAKALTLPDRYPEWESAAFVSAYPAGPVGGLSRGWGVFDGPESGERDGSVAVERALKWLPSDRPALLWVHVYEPHGPYEGSGQTERERYAEEVRLADSIIAPLIQELKARNATIVITSDHGEVLDEERCSYQHERSISDHVLKVPMVRWMPGIEPKVISGWVGLTDVPDLLAGGRIPERPNWVAQSGMCESDCAPGCSPAGLRGRDTVAMDEAGRWVERPGRGRFSVGSPGAGVTALIDAVPEMPQPMDPATEHAKSLGYISTE